MARIWKTVLRWKWVLLAVGTLGFMALWITLDAIALSRAHAATKQEVAELERVVRLLTRVPQGTTRVVINGGDTDGDIRIEFSSGQSGTMQLTLRYPVQFLNPADDSESGPPLIINVHVVDIECDGIADSVRAAYDEQFAWLEPIHMSMLKRGDAYGANVRYATDHIKKLLALHATEPRKPKPQNKSRRK